MPLLKQSSTAQPLVFRLVDATDHVTPETGLSPTVKLSKNGGSGVAPSGAVSEIDASNAPGWYKVAGNATDTNTLGPLILYATGTGAILDPGTALFEVVAFDPQAATPSVNVTQISGDSTAADNCESFFDGDGYDGSENSIGLVDTVSLLGSNALTAAGAASDFGAEIATAVWANAARTLTAATNITSTGGTTVPQTGDAYAIVNSGTFGNAAIKGFVDDIGVAGAGLTAVPWNTAWATHVFDSAESAITASFTFVGGNPQVELAAIAVSGATAVRSAIGMSVTGTIPNVTTVTTLTNLPAITANWLTAAGLATDAVAEIAAGIGGVGAFAITVTINDGEAALQNVAVSVFDGGGALAGRGTTNDDGHASLSLAAGTYTVALVKANYNFSPVIRTVTGNQAGSLVTPLSMTIITSIPASGNPGMCVVAGYIKDLNGNALVGSLVKARLVPPTNKRPITSDGNVLGLEAQTAVSNGLGYVSMELIRTDDISPDGCTYVIKCEDANLEKHNVRLTTGTLDIATL